MSITVDYTGTKVVSAVEQIVQWTSGQKITITGLQPRGTLYARAEVLSQSAVALTTKCEVDDDGNTVAPIADKVTGYRGPLTVNIVDVVDTKDEKSSTVICTVVVPVRAAAKPTDWIPDETNVITITGLLQRVSDACDRVERAVASIPSDWQEAISSTWKAGSDVDADYLVSGDDLNKISKACTRFSESSSVTGGVLNKPADVTGAFVVYTFAGERDPSRLGQVLYDFGTAGVREFTRSGGGSSWTAWEAVTGTLRDVAEEQRRDQLSMNNAYVGRDLASVLAGEIGTGETVWDALHRRVSSGDYTGMRVGDYVNVAFEDYAGVTAEGSCKFHIVHFDPRVYYGSSTLVHRIVFGADHPVKVAGEYATNTSYIVWNAARSNQGTAEQHSPYLASRLKAWETLFEACLPAALTKYLVDYSAGVETRYSSSGSLTEPDGGSSMLLGKVWSPSEVELYGNAFYGTSPFTCRSDMQFDAYRSTVRPFGHDIVWCWTRTPVTGSSTDIVVRSAYGSASTRHTDQTDARPLPHFALG